jgi:hypothetical protein
MRETKHPGPNLKPHLRSMPSPTSTPSPTKAHAEGDSPRHGHFNDTFLYPSPQDHARRWGGPPSNMHSQYPAQHWHHEAAGQSHSHYPYPPYAYGGSAPPAATYDPPPGYYGGMAPPTGYGAPIPGSWYGSPATPHPGLGGARAPDASSADGRHDPHVEWAQQHLRWVASPPRIASQAAVTPPPHQSGIEKEQEHNRQAGDSRGGHAKDGTAAVGSQGAKVAVGVHRSSTVEDTSGLATLVEATSDQERTRWVRIG